MTKERQPLTIEDALVRIAGRLTWSGVGEVLGVGERQARNYGDPDQAFAGALTLSQLIALDGAFLLAGGGEPPLHTLYALKLDRHLQGPADANVLASVTARLAEEGGRGIAALCRAAQPGARARDRAAAERDLQELDEVVHEAIGALGAPRPPPDG